ncbi:histone-lysine N-methyltransferase ATXR6-like isoform X3 [Miscanthus floridulus]|uniref:histone-lysine N-methyltransferase ATXR6-like isoform X3 n=1 Tax=Miscanthus floridulus TaxID=154761 RepID=UPI00345A4CF5
MPSWPPNAGSRKADGDIKDMTFPGPAKFRGTLIIWRTGQKMIAIVRMLEGEESILIMHKKRRILPFVPIEDGTRRVKQMASLATALSSSKTEFSNDLTYMIDMAPRSSNLARLEVLPKEGKETVELCRTMQQRGECPPLLVVVFDSVKE